MEKPTIYPEETTCWQPFNEFSSAVCWKFHWSLNTWGYWPSTNLPSANQAGSSTAMDSMAFQKAFTFMLESGIIIKSFISERHASIAK
ncbi:hypothetical protein P5673_025092 [Acropora cervicornis]|uniref:Uncharacterized protein n=1 Tax=Acropora cervicornis TaxID=6130 RepID=A0AAD9Q3B7_ACRCE|nr:hypothetical protein P5673_025092 [Acropora cervicornis]